MDESAAFAVRAGSRRPTSAEPSAVHLITLGCARNDVDSEELAAQLDSGGFRLVADPLEADAVLVNTCGFIEAAKKDSIDTVLAAADLKSAGQAKAVVAVGCLAERYGRELADSLPEADAVLGFDDYADIADRLRTILAGESHPAHRPRDRRTLLPLAPSARPAAAARCNDSWAWAGARWRCRSSQRPADVPAPTRRRRVGAAEDRFRL